MSSILRVDTLQNTNSSNLITQANATTITIGASGQTISLASGASSYGFGTSWNSTVQSSSFNAAAGNAYFVDTSTQAVTSTLPSSPSVGDEIRFLDIAGTFDTNNLTVSRNGNPIQRLTQNLTVSTESAGFSLVYSGASNGWLIRDL